MLNPAMEPSLTMFAMPAVSNETIWMNGPRRPAHFDGGMPDLRSGYYDLFDPRYQPEIDVRELK